MRLYGALSELAELIIRLASGKTVKVSASEQTAAGETVVTIPNVVDGADEFVMKDTQQSLTKKTLSGSVTTDVPGNKTSDTIISNADITANKIIIPNLTNNSDRPGDKQLEGALTLSSDDKVYVGTGLGYKVLVDLDSSETMFNKTLNNPGISGGTVSGAQIGTVGSPASIERISKLQINPGIAGTGNSHVAITNASGELVTEAQLAKSRGGIGADATNITFPASGVLVTEAGSQTLSNKTIGSVTAQSGILSVVGTGALKVPAGLGSERPASPVEGMIRYNSETDSFEGYASDTWSGLGGGGTVDRITQASHGFVVGDVLWLNGSTYAKAKADAANTAEVVGMVSRVIDASSFEMTLSGEVSGLTGLVAGEVYFLSASTAGALTAVEPSVVGQVSLSVGVASSTTSLYVAPKRGVVVGGANLRTQLNLNGAALVSQTTNIQNVTAYTAGELSGWVYIDATTDRRFYIQVQFVKDAANAWKCAYQTTGDTPPAGFNVDVVVSGADAFVQVQMPPVAGWVSGSVNFALNAPAVGATLPLQISEGLIVADGSAASPRGWAIISNADYTFTLVGASRARISGMTAARTVTLPSTGVLAGKEYELLVSGATETNFVKLQSSGGNEIDRIGGEGKILVVALQDTPTTAAHWAIIDVYEKTTATPTVTGSGVTSVANQSGYFVRINKKVTVHYGFSVTCNNIVDTFGVDFNYPARLNMINTNFNAARLPYGVVYQGGVPGICSVVPSGVNVAVTPTLGGGNFRNQTSQVQVLFTIGLN